MTGKGRAALLSLLLSPPAGAQLLTLHEAEETALRNNPRLSSVALSAQAAERQVAQARAASKPILNGFLTGTGAQTSTAIAAGALTTSSISSRAASGLALSQMITDFGRTAGLTETARLRAAAKEKDAGTTRAQVLLEVRQAYFEGLGADAVLKVARAALDSRRLVLRQIRALAQAQINSTLDVSFAEVSESQAELDLYQAENFARESHARIAAAMGYSDERTFTLSDESTLPPPEPDAAALIALAIERRPDLQSLRLAKDAAQHFAEAERKLRYPSITALAAGGVVPVRDHTLHDTYAAAGINLSLPFLNGGLYSARYAEAELRAQAADKDVLDLGVQVSRDVRIAWLEAGTAFQRLGVTERLQAQANEALRLAQARYDAGLGSIVELTQAQVTQTAAGIDAARAKYDYLTRRAVLDYTTGALQ